jgi:hypothetical protein
MRFGKAQPWPAAHYAASCIGGFACLYHTCRQLTDMALTACIRFGHHCLACVQAQSSLQSSCTALQQSAPFVCSKATCEARAAGLQLQRSVSTSAAHSAPGCDSCCRQARQTAIAVTLCSSVQCKSAVQIYSLQHFGCAMQGFLPARLSSKVTMPSTRSNTSHGKSSTVILRMASIQHLVSTRLELARPRSSTRQQASTISWPWRHDAFGFLDILVTNDQCRSESVSRTW